MRRDRATMLAAIASLPPGDRPHLESDLVDAFDRPIFDDSTAFEAGLRHYFGV